MSARLGLGRADALIYQDLDSMRRVIGRLNPELQGFEASCFDGKYITGNVSKSEFEAIAKQRSSQAGENEGRSSRLSLQSSGKG